MTTIIGKPKFDAYLKGGWYKLGDLVRDIYHESVHINLYFGRLKGFGAFGTRDNNSNAAHEVIASYYELTNRILPSMSRPEMLGVANFGKISYSRITDSGLLMSLRYMNNFFLTIK